jgi:L-ascorbate metabolism protein UlaG (beta-lactamase superfamily)
MALFSIETALYAIRAPPAARESGTGGERISFSLGKEETMSRAVKGVLQAVLMTAVLLSPGVLLAQGTTKIHWYGHPAFRIETPKGGVILIDPWLTVPTNPNKNSIAELGRVDYILVTHGHLDHVGNAVEIGKKTGAVLVAPYGLQFNMKSVLGYPEAQATTATGGNVGGTIDLPKAGAKVTLVNAVHGSELTPPTIPAPAAGQPAALHSGNPVGYVLQIEGGPTIYHTGDTDVYEDMKLVPQFFHVDLMLACIGGHFTMDPVRAALAVEVVKPKQVIPMHFGTFPLVGGTPDQFRDALAKRGLADKLIIMKPGESRAF